MFSLSSQADNHFLVYKILPGAVMMNRSFLTECQASILSGARKVGTRTRKL